MIVQGSFVFKPKIMEISIKRTCIVLLLSWLCLPAFPQAKRAPEIASILQRYKGKWPSVLTFVKTIRAQRFGEQTLKTEYHAYRYPELARIDYGSPADGNARLSRYDTVYNFSSFKGKRGYYMKDLYMSRYMMGNIYHGDLQQLQQALMKSNIDFNKTCTGRWQGREVFVYGTTAMEDNYHSQIWYDAKELYPVRYIDRAGGNNSRDTRYKISRMGNAWFPTSATEYINGKITAEIAFTAVSLEPQIDMGVFSVGDFGSVHWLKKN